MQSRFAWSLYIKMNKLSFRAEVKQRIAALDGNYISASNERIFQELIALPEFISAPRIFTYLSMGREVDTRKLIAYCEKLGKPLALPTNLHDGEMSFALIDCPIDSLPLGEFNIPAPHSSSEIVFPQLNDLILVPALCFDKNNFRLGRGGGYYDRYLSSCKAFSVGLCREALLVPAVPRESFDMQTACLITEKRIARPVRVSQR